MAGQKHTNLKQHHVDDALDYISDYWKTTKRKSSKSDETLIGLPHPYIVPGPESRHFVFNEQYYWDSYFIVLGIDDEKLVTGMLDNLIYLFEKFGLIPNANRYYFTSRSQPPILTTFIFHVYDKYKKSDSWLKEKIKVAQEEYETVWMSSDHPHSRKVHDGLSRYYDINFLHDLAEAESGWDMTPRFQRQCLDFIPFDLTCLLYKYESDFRRAAELFGDDQQVAKWQMAMNARRKAANTYHWHNRHKFFFDYNFQKDEKSDVWSVAAYYALWSGLATSAQASELVDKLHRFEKKGGLTTTIGNFMYYNLFGSTKTQWAYPNGWAPLHYFAIEGLENYNFAAAAQRVAKRWLHTNLEWFEDHGEFLEKYNVVNPDLKPAEGLYPSQTGFGWTNGVFVYLADKYL